MPSRIQELAQSVADNGAHWVEDSAALQEIAVLTIEPFRRMYDRFPDYRETVIRMAGDVLMERFLDLDERYAWDFNRDLNGHDRMPDDVEDYLLTWYSRAKARAVLSGRLRPPTITKTGRVA